ncbi:MAG TPA: 4Fe-4S dicluster domain-containing protein [Planctomycetota bacterium]|nr:4Fe-4S dicluster domain-containing protein [Planctomycetota bacterium]
MATTATAASLFQASAGWLAAAAEKLRAAGIEVLAPIEREQGRVDLAPLEGRNGLAANYLNTVLPLKRLSFPETEVILNYDKRENKDVALDVPSAPAGERVVLGCRPCDASALAALDQVFEWDYDDVRYRQHRERTTVVAFACTEPDGHCFCTSVGGSPQGEAGSDVLAYPTKDGGALLKPLTEKGAQLMERLEGVVQPAPEGAKLPAPPLVKPKFDPDKVKPWLDEHFEDAFWTEATLACVGCGACSYLCPTCHCFDIVDEAVWNRGERRRNWDCCSFSLFTLHASGHNPRASQAARYRQRVMHKFKYFPERFGRLACVGCGRCVRTCGVGQSLVAVLADIEARNGTGG